MLPPALLVNSKSNFPERVPFHLFWIPHISDPFSLVPPLLILLGFGDEGIKAESIGREAVAAA